MIVQCSQCSKTLKVPDTAAGKRVRCPACSGVVEVPLVASAQSPSHAGAASQSAVAGGRDDTAKGEGTKSPSPKEVPTSSSVIRRARAISSESRGSGDSSTASTGGSEPSVTKPAAKEASSRGKGGRSDGVRESRSSDRGGSVRSSSSGKPRRRARPAELEVMRTMAQTILSQIRLLHLKLVLHHRQDVPGGRLILPRESWQVWVC